MSSRAERWAAGPATPALAPEVAEARRLDRLLAGRPDAGKPDRRERRERRDRKGWDGR